MACQPYFFVHNPFGDMDCYRRVGNKLPRNQKNTNSVCFKHVENNPGYQMDYENIDKASTDFKLRMKEFLRILKRKPDKNTFEFNRTILLCFFVLDIFLSIFVILCIFLLFSL